MHRHKHRGCSSSIVASLLRQLAINKDWLLRLFLASRTECTACKLPTMDEALAAAAAPLGESWVPPPVKRKAKKHKKKR